MCLDCRLTTSSLKLQAKREKSIKFLLDSFHFPYLRPFSSIPRANLISAGSTLSFQRLFAFSMKDSLERSIRFNFFAILVLNWKSRPKQPTHPYLMGNRVILKYNLFAPPTRSCLCVYPGFCAAYFPLPSFSIIDWKGEYLLLISIWLWARGNKEPIQSPLLWRGMQPHIRVSAPCIRARFVSVN